MNLTVKALPAQPLHIGDLLAKPRPAAHPKLFADFAPPEPLPAEPHAVAFTIMTGEARLTKAFTADVAGAPIQKDAPGVPRRAKADRTTVSGDSAAIATGFASILAGLTVNQALVLAPPPAAKHSWAVVPMGEIGQNEGAIAKTKVNFPAPTGAALVGLDLDIKTWPEFLLRRLAEYQDISGALRSVFPALGAATYVQRPSVSAGICNRKTGHKTGPNSGQHRFYFAKSGSDVEGDEGFAARLHDHLVLAGFGFGVVNAAGRVITKTLIDRSASQDYSRYWYEANAHLEAVDLQHDPNVRVPKIVNPNGGLLDTSLLPKLTDEQRAQLGAIEATIVAELEPQAAPVRARWRADRQAALVAKGVPADRAAKAVGLAVEQHVLTEDFTLDFDNGSSATVAEIMDNPARYHGLTGPDPFEPNYGNGRNLAILYAESSSEARIYSHAHGGIHYRLVRNPAHWFVDPATIDLPAETVSPTDPATVAVQRLNDRHAVVRQGGKALIITEAADGEVSFGTVANIRDWYANDTIIQNKKPATVFEVWLQSPLRRQYEQVVFAPEGGPARSFNLWRGFAVKPDIAASCRLFLEHVRANVCGGDSQLYAWVISFFAQMVQRPGEKPGVALVLRGGQGTGKSIVGKYVGALFPAHHVIVSQPDHLTGRFNSHLERAILVQAEEAFWAGDRVAAGGALKDLITSDHMRIERKGIDTIQVRNNVRVLITTNSKWAVPAGVDERRFAVLDVADHRKQDTNYFGAIAAEMASGGLGGLLHFLQAYDLGSVNLRHIPATEALLDQKLASLEPLERWWLSRLQSGTFQYSEGWPEEISKAEFYADYERPTAKIARPMHEAEFGRSIRRICPGIGERRPRKGEARPRVFNLPELTVCRDAFSEMLGTRLDWESN